MTKEAGSKSELLTLFDDDELFDVGFPGEGNNDNDSPFAVVEDVEETVSKKEVKKQEVAKKETEENLEFNPEELLNKNTNEDNEAPQVNNDNNNSSPASIFATFLLDKGVLSSFNQEEFNTYLKENGEEEALSYLYEVEVESRYSDAKKQLAEDKSEILTYFDMLDSGVDPNEAKPLAYEKKKYSSIKENELEDNESLRKDILNMYYKSKGFSQKEIDRSVKSLVNSGEDVEAAKDSLKELNASIDKRIKEAEVNAKKEYDEAERRRVELINNLHSKVDSTKEIFGNSINKQTHTKLKEFLTPVESNGRMVDGLTNWLIKDPDNKIKLAYMILSGIADGDLSKINNIKKTSAINELEKALKTNKASISEGNHTIEQGSKTSALDALTKAMDNNKQFPKKN